VVAVLRQGATLLIASACSLVVLTVGRAEAAAPVCAKLKETSLHWDAVFAHVSSLSQAQVLRGQIAHYGFQHVIFDKDWCDDVEVLIPGLDTPTQRRAFAEEAVAVGFQVSYEPPYTYRKPHRGYLKAIFGIEKTLSRANDLQRSLAQHGYREATDIERINSRTWHVVLYRIPARLQAQFAAEAKRAGFPVLGFEP
jgi:hypothetical protein